MYKKKQNNSSDFNRCNNHQNNYGFNSIQIIQIVSKISSINGKLNKHFDLIGRFNDLYLNI